MEINLGNAIYANSGMGVIFQLDLSGIMAVLSKNDLGVNAWVKGHAIPSYILGNDVDHPLNYRSDGQGKLFYQETQF